jgi:type I restriction enzyme S subunit
MDYKRYEDYKDSGVEWIGQMPEEWIAKPLKNITSFVNGAAFKPTDWEDEGVPIIRIANLNGSSEYNKTTMSVNAKYYVKEGDLLFAWSGNRGTSFGPFLWNEEGLYYLNQHIFRLANYQVHKKWFYWVLKGVTAFIEQQAHGIIGLVHVTKQDLGNIQIPYPLINEQRKIANFIDNKVSEIDELIANKEKFIELLKEQRQAIITEAVTKGLNPNVKMKNSGIEWIGEIPEHWEVKKLRYIGSCQNGLSKAGEFFGKGHPFVSYGDVYKNMELPHMVVGLVESTDSERKNCSVKRGDVFFTRTSEVVNEIAFASTCLKTIHNATFAGFLIRFRPLAVKIVPEFSKYYFRCQLHRAYFVKEMNLVTRASLSQELLKNLPVLLPPIDEQKNIGAYLDNITTATDFVIDDNLKQIENLKEYRQSLISEAVTGKIDVRGYSA